jgi:Fe-S oxidoreductase
MHIVLLAVEFEGETPQAAAAAARATGVRGTLLEDPAAQAGFWEVRRAGLGLLMSVPGDVKPNTFIEDVAVPVASLATYVRRVDAILAESHTYGEWYAHASAGCLHLRPMLNLKTADGRHEMRRIAEAIVDVACELGGAVSGEHGDGLSHTAFNERLFGPTLTDAFRRWKRAFDPKGILNPGKVVVMPGDPVPAIDGDMRYRPDYGPRLELATQFAYRREQGFLRALESCSGVGVCRKSGGVMCPSYQATREESDSTRGRANALRAALTGTLPPGTLLRPEMHRVLDLCLECKGCKAECPTAVDMARIKAEYLALYQRSHGLPMRSRLFGEIARIQSVLALGASVQNGLRRTGVFRRGLELVFGIDRRRTLPALRRRAFRREVPVIRPETISGRDGVILFVDTFMDHNETEVGRSAFELLRRAGLTVGRAAAQVCCGRPMISKGMLSEARRLARKNIDALAPYARAGWPIVGLEPSCLLTLRDEYLEFFPDDEDARSVAAATRLLEECLLEVQHGRRGKPLVIDGSGKRVLLHNHCHSRALVGSQPMLDVLLATGAAVRESGAGCCGMAGSFGYEKEHYDLSMRIGEMRLFPEVLRAAGEGEIVLAPGTSCRTQVRDGTGTEAMHPAVFLAASLRSRGDLA